MDKKIILEPVSLIVIALVFTVGLMYASVELPSAVDRMIADNIQFLDVATGQDALTDYKTELYLSRYHIRLIGYVCLGLVFILIVAGFILEKIGLASAGAIILFLPVFGHFAATMFFLGGLGFLRFLWLPFLDISFDVMRLGEIVLLPYDWLLDGFELMGMNLHRELPLIITGLGIFIFLMGVIAWMYGRIHHRDVADFWIYRLSRHPQYLGWIIWSYGILLLPAANMKQYLTVPNSFPWLLSTMIIIGVALLEERTMVRRFGTSYLSYRERTFFIIPVPRFLRGIFSLPLRLIFKKEYPERKREIVAVTTFYTVLCITLSAFAAEIIQLPRDRAIPETQIKRLVLTIKTSQHRGEIRRAANSLATSGEAGMDSLINLLRHENSFVRWYCADALGNVQSEKIVKPLANLLSDPDYNVRQAATGALGGAGSDLAVPFLIEALQDPDKGDESSAARSLGRFRAVQAVPLLIQGLSSDNRATVLSSAWALGEIGSEEAIQPLISSLERNAGWHYFAVGEALQKLGSSAAEAAFIAGLRKGDWWLQTSCASALGELGTLQGFHALVDAMQIDNVRVRRSAVLALSGYPVPQSASVLEQALNDADWEVRMYARAALEKSGK